jgi:metallo-beta-lactamase family protein
MLADAALLAENDARHLNKRRGRDEPPVEPLYRQEDVDRTLELFRVHDYREPFEPVRGARASFRDAGHILGSSGVLLEYERGPTVYFTGDLGRRTYPILRDPEPLPECDVVLTECTYGTREHEPLGDAEGVLRRAVERACKEKGKLFVPAFSVGRTQNLVYAMARLWEQDAIPRIPIYVDSPLALEATRAFADNPDVFDSEVRAFIGEGGDPFYPHGVRYLKTREQSMELNDRSGPFMVIAGSGMCEGGRIVHHLANGIGDPRNTVLFVGFAAPNTLARRILDGQEEVRILGHPHRVRATVERIGAYSAHADRADLLRFLAPARAFGASLYLVHGDEATCLAFADTLRAEGHAEVVVPETYASYVIERR